MCPSSLNIVIWKQNISEGQNLWNESTEGSYLSQYLEGIPFVQLLVFFWKRKRLSHAIVWFKLTPHGLFLIISFILWRKCNKRKLFLIVLNLELWQIEKWMNNDTFGEILFRFHITYCSLLRNMPLFVIYDFKIFV